MNGAAGQQFVGQDADGVYTAARAGVTVPTCSGDRYAAVPRMTLVEVILAGDRAHQAEVGDLDLAVVGDQHVLGL